MTGTLDDPPIIIRQSRMKLAVLIFFAFLLAVPCFWVVWTRATHDLVWAYSGLGFFGGGGLCAAWLLIRPGTLILHRDGLTWRTFGHIKRHSWNDFIDFIVWSPRGPMKQPACIYSDSYWKNHRLGALTGGKGSFGPCWNMPVAQMVDLLNQARRRWTL